MYLWVWLWLCLVAVKRFPENTYFPEMLISGKGKYFSVFGCISKNFPENIFWCLEKKKENTNPRKISSTIAIWDRDLAGAMSRRRSRSRDQRRELATARSRDRSEIAISRRRDLAPSIAIWGASSRSRSCDSARSQSSRDRAAWSSDWRSAPPGDRLTVWFLLLSLARALSLSFSGNALKWKWEEKIISGSKVKILVNRKSFSGKYHFLWQPNMRKRVKMISWNHFHPKQTHPKSIH